MMRRLWVPALVCALAPWTTGCSYLLVQRAPRPPPEDKWVRCTENPAMPVVDALVAALVLSPLVYIAVAEDNQSDRTLGLVLGVPFFGSTAVAYGSSSFYGFRETNRCRQLHRAYESMEPLPDASPAPSADSR